MSGAFKQPITKLTFHPKKSNYGCWVILIPVPWCERIDTETLAANWAVKSLYNTTIFSSFVSVFPEFYAQASWASDAKCAQHPPIKPDGHAVFNLPKQAE